MKLKVLVDNNTIIDEYYLGEPALSFYIEDEEQKILFDTGYSSIYLENAEEMGIDLSKVNKIVISHGHDDHTGGLPFFFKTFDTNKIELITHPNCFEEKYSEKLYIGSPITKEIISKRLKLTLTPEPLQISKNITYLGEIPVTKEYEKRIPIGTRKDNDKIEPDYLLDDSAIVYKSPKGLFIITGCSHSGICNIIEHAKKVCNCNKVYGIIGGFHLFEDNSKLQETINYFKENKIEEIYPCHCVSLQCKIKMGNEINIKEVGVGTEIQI